MRNYNFKIFAIALIISLIGVSTIYSTKFQRGQIEQNLVFMRQIIWIILSLCILLIIYKWDYRKLWDIAYLLYGITLFLLILVLILGNIRLGAQRWLKVFWFNFQPSELAKLTTVIFLARFFSYKSISDMGRSAKIFGLFKGLVLPLFMIAIPMGLILEQPDLGSALMLFFIFVSLLYLAEVRPRRILILLLAVAASLPLFWEFLRDYQKERLLVFLNPNIDPLGAGYTVIQSKIAIGSGGLFGKGWLYGTQSQLRFLPESHTDFIFATFAEEWGFLGCAFLIFLYYLLIKYSLDIASRTNDYFAKLLASGIACIFAIQVFINISMTLGLAPIVGLPLILTSYGGSSVLIAFVSLGILMNINKNRAVF
jgi:rod shape determining protein RodA